MFSKLDLLCFSKKLSQVLIFTSVGSGLDIATNTVAFAI